MVSTIHTFIFIAITSSVFGGFIIFPDDPEYHRMLSVLRVSTRKVMPTQRIGLKELKTEKDESQIMSQKALSKLISNSINTFGQQLNTALGAPNEAFVFSPLNIAEALLLLWLGSNGVTFNEIAEVMKFQNLDTQHQSHKIHETFGSMLQSFASDNPNHPKLTTASGLFVQDGYPIGQKYKQIATESYKSDVVYLDFAKENLRAQSSVNDWVSSKTNGLIKNIMPSPPSTQTKVLLATALYFKGAWDKPFPSDLTRRARFYPHGRDNNTGVVEVDMMVNYDTFKYGYNKDLNSETLCLPYKGNTVSMCFIAPKMSSIAKLKAVQEKLTPAVVDQLMEDLKPMQLGILVPKMKFESTTSLKSIFRTLGVQSLFEPQTANLNVLSSEFGYPNNTIETIDQIRNAITNNPQLYVEEIVHKVFIDVNEVGTEAAAATDLLIPRGGIKTFELNKPFAFFIRHHETNLNLFWGTVNTPLPNYM